MKLTGCGHTGAGVVGEDVDVADAMGMWQHGVKRLLDFVFALVGIVVLSPLMLVICILLKAQRNGPAIFSQERIGQGGKPFTIYKFRTMSGRLKASRHILSLFADMLYKANEVFRRAIDAIIHFGTEQHKSVFSPSEAADIKSVMQEYGETPEQHSAVGAWLCDYAESRQPFDEIKHRHTLKEVGDVAEGKYDWKINSTQSNGLSR